MGEDQTALLNPILGDINININIPTAREFIDLYEEFNADNYAPFLDSGEYMVKSILPLLPLPLLFV